MKLEQRLTTDGAGRVILRGIVGVVESEAESRLLDELFGSQVDEKGLIGTTQVECRLSDAYREHYVYFQANAQEVKCEDRNRINHEDRDALDGGPRAKSL